MLSSLSFGGRVPVAVLLLRRLFGLLCRLDVAAAPLPLHGDLPTLGLLLLLFDQAVPQGLQGPAPVRDLVLGVHVHLGVGLLEAVRQEAGVPAEVPGAAGLDDAAGRLADEDERLRVGAVAVAECADCLRRLRERTFCSFI